MEMINNYFLDICKKKLSSTGLKRLVFLTFLAISSFFSNTYAKGHLSKADSLSYCGYFDQEIAVRRQLLANSNLEDVEKQTEQIYLKLAELNYSQQNSVDFDADAAFAEIIGQYRLSNKKVRDNTAIEIGRLIAINYIEKEKFEEALKLLKKLLARTNKSSILHASLNLNIAQMYLNGQRKYFDAMPYYKAAIQGFESNGMGNHYINALAWSDLSFAYDRGEIETEKMACSEKAHQIWTNFYAKDAQIVSNSYNNLLEDVLDYGDKFLSKKYQTDYDNYIKKYLKDGKANYLSQSNEFSTLSLYYLTVVRYYLANFDKNKLLEALNAQEKLFKRAPVKFQKKENSVLLSTYDNLSYAFYMNNDAQNALKFTQIMEQKADSDFYKMKAEANRAMLYYYNHNHSKAIFHTQKSLDFLELLGYKSSYKTLLTLKAELQSNLGQYEAAKNTLKDLFELIFDKGFKYQNLDMKDYKEVASSSDINILIHSGMTYSVIYEKNGKKKEDLKILKNFYNTAAKMFRVYYQKGYFNSSLESQLGKIKEGLLFGAVQDPLDKIYASNSVDAIENNESQHLWKQFLMKNSQNIRISKDILDKKNGIELEINYLESLSESSAKDSIELVKQKQNLLKIEEDIKLDNPIYERYSTFDFDIKKLQSQLLEDDLILKYIVTDSSVFGVKISSSHLSIKHLGKRKEIESLSKEYYQDLTSLSFDYVKKSSKMFHLLVEPFEINQNSKIRIITEGFLNYLSFETLKEGEKGFLTQNHTLSYVNGLKFLTLEKEHSKNSFEQHFAGFAPEYSRGINESRSENGILLYTGKELQKIAKTLGGGALYLKTEATKTKFLESLARATFIIWRCIQILMKTIIIILV